jgi:hypothetical protein
LEHGICANRGNWNAGGDLGGGESAKSGSISFDESVFRGKSRETPIWKKDISETYSMGDLEYLEKLERHQKDP